MALPDYTPDSYVAGSSFGPEDATRIETALNSAVDEINVLIAAVNDLATAVAAKGDATISGGLKQFPDVSTTAPTDNQSLVYDTDVSKYVPSSLGTRFVEKDISSGRMDDEALPLFVLRGEIVNSGAQPSPGAPAGSVILRRQAAPSLIPILGDDGFAQNSATLVLTTTQAFAVNDWIGFAIGSSGEVEIPGLYTFAYATGAGTVVSAQLTSSGTAVANFYYAKVTTNIPAGTNITVTSRNAGNTANNNRVHFMGSVFKMPNLAALTPLDQVASGTGASNSTLDKSLTTGGATTTNSQLAVMVFVLNAGTSTLVRTAQPTNNWNQLSLVTSSVTAGAREMLVAYKVLSAAATVTGNVHIESTDATSGGWSMSLATFKAA